MKYCKWRTEVVFNYALTRDKKDVSYDKNNSFQFTPQKYFSGNWQGATPDSSYRFPVFRLPTQKEWLEFATADSLSQYPFGVDFSKRKLKRNLIDSSYFGCLTHPSNFDKSATTEEADQDNPDASKFKCEHNLPTNNAAYFANQFGLYDVIGSVSEMVDEKGIAMGGNFTSYVTKIDLTKPSHYSKEKAWIGFRCVAEYMTWSEYQEHLKTQD